MRKLNIKNILFKASVIFLVISLFATFAVVSHANNVVILEETDPELTFVKIHEVTKERNDVWADIKGSFSQEGNKYTLVSNGFAQWYEVDSLHFAYKKVNFNYGKKAELVIETQMDSWNGLDDNAGAGLMIRSGLHAGAATIQLHTRPTRVMITYRAADGMLSFRGPELHGLVSYPIKFKMVLNKNTVSCYYKQSNNPDYIFFQSIPIQYTGAVYVGLSAYSQNESDMAEANFTGFNYQVLAPEGTEVLPDDGSGNDSVPEEVPVTPIPDDFPVAEDVLLYESFTDNSMFEGEESVTNPIWKTNNFGEPDIVTNEERTNRYLYENDSFFYYYAGDHNWTDYETSVDLCFTDANQPGMAGKVDLYTRLSTVAQYGYHSYVVRFSGGNKIQLGYIEGHESLSPDDISTVYSLVVKDSYSYNYFGNLGTNINITIRTVDNIVTVFMDDGTGKKEILSFVDDHDFVKTTGKIGFSTKGVAVTLDNIKVVKVDDLLGGDYDNKIGGRWDEPIPEYIQKEYIDKGYTY